MPDGELIEVVITAPDEGWLVAFTRRLVEQRLVACGHHTSIRSVYTWGDQIHDLHEARVALHTRAEHFDAISVLTNTEHPYEVPCVIAVSIAHASPSYRRWVLAATTPGHVGPS